MPKAAPAQWAKSSYSGQQADCVEWKQGTVDGLVDVRDSKATDGKHLAIPQERWCDMVEAIARTA